MKMRVSGLRELDKALGDLPNAVGKRVLRKVARQELEPMANRAAALAPERTGKLAFSVSVSEQRTARAKVRGGFDRRNGISMAMGPAGGTGALNYATFAEFGTIDTAAHPFMRPTWDSMADPSLESIKSKMWAEISKAAGRQARRAAKRAAA